MTKIKYQKIWVIKKKLTGLIRCYACQDCLHTIVSNNSKGKYTIGFNSSEDIIERIDSGICSKCECEIQPIELNQLKLDGFSHE